MNASPRAALRRITALLLVTCVLAFAWESWRDAGMRSTTGRVVAVRQVLSSGGGDSREFTIRYRAGGADHYLVTRRGVLDSLTGLRGLSRGDAVPLEVSDGAPWRAELGTLTGRYPMTICFGVLTSIVLAITVLVVRRSRV